MRSRVCRRFLPICEGALETRQVLSSTTAMSLAPSAAVPTIAPATPTPEAQQTAPSLVGANAVKDGRGRIIAIEVHYSTKMDPASASRTGPFLVDLDAAKGHRVLHQSLRLASASYDDARDVTTLVLARPLASKSLFVRSASSKSLIVQVNPSEILGASGLAMQGDYKAVVS